MPRDDEPLDEPWVNAVVVPGSADGTEAVDVLIAWDDLGEIGETARRLLPEVARQMATSERWGGEIRFLLPDEFVPDTKRNRELVAELEETLGADAAAIGVTAASGAPVRVRVRIGIGR